MKNKAFTLLEMIVVVSIIAILFLLTVPNIMKLLKNVEKKSCEAMTKVVDTAILQYKLDFDEFPASTQDLVSGGYLSEKQIKCSDGTAIYIDADNHAQVGS